MQSQCCHSMHSSVAAHVAPFDVVMVVRNANSSNGSRWLLRGDGALRMNTLTALGRAGFTDLRTLPTSCKPDEARAPTRTREKKHGSYITPLFDPFLATFLITPPASKQPQLHRSHSFPKSLDLPHSLYTKIQRPTNHIQNAVSPRRHFRRPGRRHAPKLRRLCSQLRRVLCSGSSVQRPCHHSCSRVPSRADFRCCCPCRC